jgi:gas vesicle protein
MKKLFRTLLGTCLYLLEQSDSARKGRDRAARKLDGFRDVAQQKYEDAADRVTKTSSAILGEDNHALANTLRFAAGLGVGVGVGLLLAPASGQDTRSAIGGSVQNVGRRVRKRVFSERARATSNAG